MSQEKQIIRLDLLKNHPIWQNKAARVACVCLFVVFAFIAVFLTLLQIMIFEVPQTLIQPEDYVAGHLSEMVYSEEGFEVTVPEEVIAAVCSNFIGELLEDSKVTLKSIAYDSEKQRIEMNLSYLGFYFPVSYAISVAQRNEGFELICTDARLTNRDLTFGGISSLVSRRIFQGTGLLRVYAYEEVGVNANLKVSQFEMNQGLIDMRIEVDEDLVKDELVEIIGDVAPHLLEHYMTYSSDRTEPVLALMDGEPDSQDVIDAVNDVIGDKAVITDLLLLAERYDITEMEALFEDYGIDFDFEAVLTERKAFEGQAADYIIAQVFESLNSYFAEKTLGNNQGKPFDIETMTTITVAKLNEIYGLELDEEVLSALSFIYDDEFKLAYRLDSTTYYIRSVSDYEVVDLETFKSYQGSEEVKDVYYVNDSFMWNQVTALSAESLGVEDVFVRYMKTDGESVFAVVSDMEDPQRFYGLAFMYEEGNLTLLEKGVTSISALMATQKDFNIETATDTIETTTFKRIGDDIHELIIDELYGQGMISSNNDIQVIYSSYDGLKYIAFKLSNGDEYVYKVQITVYGTYLTDVYSKEKAVRNWSDIPELLLLQDPPSDETEVTE